MRGDPEANNLSQTSLPHPMFNNRLCREGRGRGGRTTLGVWLPRHGQWGPFTDEEVKQRPKVAQPWGRLGLRQGQPGG